MSAQLLATKLYRPALRPQTVPRPRLVTHLDAGLHRKLTLVSAAAGFGKTTLVAEWTAGGNRPVAWLFLDEGDSDPARFFAYLIAALQTIDPNLGANLSGILQAAQLPALDALMAALINEIAAVSNPFTLVLDDYHRLEAPPIDQALAFLLEHQPPQLHLAIATREDPQLPLARLRALGQLTELRAADLRFDHEETAGFLNKMMGLNLSPAEIDSLEMRTEGWIAGLQMAALSMQGRDDTAAFIQAFAGDHRFVLDYLFEEVLQRQSESVRSFLLETSVLDQLTGSLCDAVTGQIGGKDMLEELERSNLFVVSLDDRRQWYRYHHLFADVLQAHLFDEQAERLSTLHRRASDWYEKNGFPSEAIDHALAGEDYQRAAGLIELQARPSRRSATEATWLGWVKALPPDILRARPVLSVHFGLAALPGVLDTTETYLRDGERWLEALDAGADVSGMLVADDIEFRSLPGTIAIARAYRAGALGDLQGIMDNAQKALALLPSEDHLWRGAAAVLMGLAEWSLGHVDAAYRLVAEGKTSLEAMADPMSITGSYYLLAGIRMAQGRLRDAERVCHQGLQFAERQQQAIVQGTADLHVTLAEIALERADLAAAADHLQQAADLGDLAALLESRHRRAAVASRLLATRGDLDGALDLCDEADRRFLGGPAPEVQPLAALRAQVWIKQGRLDEAASWARAAGLSADDELSYPREFENLTLARLLLARFRKEADADALQDAHALLERLLLAAQTGRRTGSQVESLVLLALTHEVQGDASAARESLAEALALAQPEGFMRVFLSEGAAMAQMLSEGVSNGLAPEYAQYVLAAFATLQSEPETPHVARASSDSQLRDPLSERELDVLRLLATELSGPDIASELMVSLNTVRTHTKNIYSKLGVNNRRSAVARAAELGLL